LKDVELENLVLEKGENSITGQNLIWNSVAEVELIMLLAKPVPNQYHVQ